MSDHVVQHMEQEEGINIMRQCVPLWVGPVGRGTSGGVSRNNGNGNHIGLLVRYKWLNGQAAAEEEGIWDTVVFATGEEERACIYRSILYYGNSVHVCLPILV